MAYNEIPMVTLPSCDVCKAKGCQPVKPAKYDSRLHQYNTWGYTCHTHFHEYGVKSTASKLVLTEVELTLPANRKIAR